MSASNRDSYFGITRESHISRERAKKILDNDGSGDSFDPDADYTVAVLSDGTERLFCVGCEVPLAANRDRTSWI